MLHHACCTLQRLNLTLQCPLCCPGLATHTLAELCALWLPSAASSSFGDLHRRAKPQAPQTTCPNALQQPPVQAPPHMLHTAEPAFALFVSNGMPRAGHSHAGRALCTVVAEWHLRLKHPVQAPPHLLNTARAASDLAMANGMPRAGHSHTGSVLCTVVVKRHFLN